MAAYHPIEITPPDPGTQGGTDIDGAHAIVVQITTFY